MDRITDHFVISLGPDSKMSSSFEDVTTLLPGNEQ